MVVEIDEDDEEVVENGEDDDEDEDEERALFHRSLRSALLSGGSVRPLRFIRLDSTLVESEFEFAPSILLLLLEIGADGDDSG